MNSCKADNFFRAVNVNFNVPAVSNRQIVLRGLPIFREVGIIIIFPVELAVLVNFAVGGESGFNGELNDAPIYRRQDARQAQAHGANMRILLRAEGRCTAAENFRRGLQFAVNFQSDNSFIFQNQSPQKIFKPFNFILVVNANLFSRSACRCLPEFQSPPL